MPDPIYPNPAAKRYNRRAPKGVDPGQWEAAWGSGDTATLAALSRPMMSPRDIKKSQLDEIAAYFEAQKGAQTPATVTKQGLRPSGAPRSFAATPPRAPYDPRTEKYLPAPGTPTPAFAAPGGLTPQEVRAMSGAGTYNPAEEEAAGGEPTGTTLNPAEDELVDWSIYKPPTTDKAGPKTFADRLATVNMTPEQFDEMPAWGKSYALEELKYWEGQGGIPDWEKYIAGDIAEGESDLVKFVQKFQTDLPTSVDPISGKSVSDVTSLWAGYNALPDGDPRKTASMRDQLLQLGNQLLDATGVWRTNLVTAMTSLEATNRTKADIRAKSITDSIDRVYNTAEKQMDRALEKYKADSTNATAITGIQMQIDATKALAEKKYKLTVQVGDNQREIEGTRVELELAVQQGSLEEAVRHNQALEKLDADRIQLQREEQSWKRLMDMVGNGGIGLFTLAMGGPEGAEDTFSQLLGEINPALKGGFTAQGAGPLAAARGFKAQQAEWGELQIPSAQQVSKMSPAEVARYQAAFKSEGRDFETEFARLVPESGTPGAVTRRRR